MRMCRLAATLAVSLARRAVSDAQECVAIGTDASLLQVKSRVARYGGTSSPPTEYKVPSASGQAYLQEIRNLTYHCFLTAASLPIAMAQAAGHSTGGAGSASILTWVKWGLLVALVLLAIIFVGAALLLLFLGRALKAGIEHFDRSCLGVDVDIGELTVSACHGRVEVRGVIVHSPPGFKSAHVFAAERILVDFNLRSLILSLGRRIEVESIKLIKIDCIVEWDGYIAGLSESNVSHILDHLQGHGGNREKPSKRRQRKPDVASAQAQKGSEREVHVYNVEMVDIGARLQTKLMGARVEIADVTHEDFSKEVGSYVFDDIVWEVLKSLVKTIVSNLSTKAFADRLL